MDELKKSILRRLPGYGEISTSFEFPGLRVINLLSSFSLFGLILRNTKNIDCIRIERIVERKLLLLLKYANDHDIVAFSENVHLRRYLGIENVTDRVLVRFYTLLQQIGDEDKLSSLTFQDILSLDSISDYFVNLKTVDLLYWEAYSELIDRLVNVELDWGSSLSLERSLVFFTGDYVLADAGLSSTINLSPQSGFRTSVPSPPSTSKDSREDGSKFYRSSALDAVGRNLEIDSLSSKQDADLFLDLLWGIVSYEERRKQILHISDRVGNTKVSERISGLSEDEFADILGEAHRRYLRYSISPTTFNHGSDRFNFFCKVHFSLLEDCDLPDFVFTVLSQHYLSNFIIENKASTVAVDGVKVHSSSKIFQTAEYRNSMIPPSKSLRIIEGTGIHNLQSLPNLWNDIAGCFGLNREQLFLFPEGMSLEDDYLKMASPRFRAVVARRLGEGDVDEFLVALVDQVRAVVETSQIDCYIETGIWVRVLHLGILSDMNQTLEDSFFEFLVPNFLVSEQGSRETGNVRPFPQSADELPRLELHALSEGASRFIAIESDSLFSPRYENGEFVFGFREIRGEEIDSFQVGEERDNEASKVYGTRFSEGMKRGIGTNRGQELSRGYEKLGLSSFNGAFSQLNLPITKEYLDGMLRVKQTEMEEIGSFWRNSRRYNEVKQFWEECGEYLRSDGQNVLDLWKHLPYICKVQIQRDYMEILTSQRSIGLSCNWIGRSVGLYENWNPFKKILSVTNLAADARNSFESTSNKSLIALHNLQITGLHHPSFFRQIIYKNNPASFRFIKGSESNVAKSTGNESKVAKSKKSSTERLPNGRYSTERFPNVRSLVACNSSDKSLSKRRSQRSHIGEMISQLSNLRQVPDHLLDKLGKSPPISKVAPFFNLLAGRGEVTSEQIHTPRYLEMAIRTSGSLPDLVKQFPPSYHRYYSGKSVGPRTPEMVYNTPYPVRCSTEEHNDRIFRYYAGDNRLSRSVYQDFEAELTQLNIGSKSRWRGKYAYKRKRTKHSTSKMDGWVINFEEKRFLSMIQIDTIATIGDMIQFLSNSSRMSLLQHSDELFKRQNILNREEWESVVNSGSERGYAMLLYSHYTDYLYRRYSDLPIELSFDPKYTHLERMFFRGSSNIRDITEFYLRPDRYKELSAKLLDSYANLGLKVDHYMRYLTFSADDIVANYLAWSMVKFANQRSYHIADPDLLIQFALTTRAPNLAISPIDGSYMINTQGRMTTYRSFGEKILCDDLSPQVFRGDIGDVLGEVGSRVKFYHKGKNGIVEDKAQLPEAISFSLDVSPLITYACKLRMFFTELRDEIFQADVTRFDTIRSFSQDYDCVDHIQSIAEKYRVRYLNL